MLPPGCPRPSIALQVQNSGLKYYSFPLVNSYRCCKPCICSAKLYWAGKNLISWVQMHNVIRTVNKQCMSNERYLKVLYYIPVNFSSGLLLQITPSCLSQSNHVTNPYNSRITLSFLSLSSSSLFVSLFALSVSLFSVCLFALSVSALFVCFSALCLSLSIYLSLRSLSVSPLCLSVLCLSAPCLSLRSLSVSPLIVCLCSLFFSMLCLSLRSLSLRTCHNDPNFNHLCMPPMFFVTLAPNTASNYGLYTYRF